MQTKKELKVAPIVKYAALSLFFDRFYPSFSRSQLQLQLFHLHTYFRNLIQFFFSQITLTMNLQFSWTEASIVSQHYLYICSFFSQITLHINLHLWFNYSIFMNWNINCITTYTIIDLCMLSFFHFFFLILFFQLFLGALRMTINLRLGLNNFILVLLKFYF